MTRATYRKLNAVRWVGAAVLLPLIVGGWLRLVPIGLIFVTMIVVGFSAAIAAWVIRDQDYEELPY